MSPVTVKIISALKNQSTEWIPAVMYLENGYGLGGLNIALPERNLNMKTAMEFANRKTDSPEEHGGGSIYV